MSREEIIKGLTELEQALYNDVVYDGENTDLYTLMGKIEYLIKLFKAEVSDKDEILRLVQELQNIISQMHLDNAVTKIEVVEGAFKVTEIDGDTYTIDLRNVSGIQDIRSDVDTNTASINTLDGEVAKKNTQNIFTKLNTFEGTTGNYVEVDEHGVFVGGEVNGEGHHVFVECDGIDFECDHFGQGYKLNCENGKFLIEEYEKTLNLLNIQNLSTTTKSGVDYSVNGNIITFNNAPTEAINIYIYLANNYTLENGKPYYFKHFTEIKTTYGIDTYLRFSDNTAQNVSDSLVITGNGKTITALQFFCRVGFTYNNLQIKDMLVKGSTAPSTFTKYYGDIVHEIDLGTLLWKNGSPTNAFTHQNLSIDISKYKSFIIRYSNYKGWATQEVKITNAFSGGNNFVLIGSANSGVYLLQRSCSLNFSTNQMVINDCYSAGNLNNDFCIPIEIYGVK